MREVQRKKVEETKRDETEEEKRGDGRGGGPSEQCNNLQVL